MTERDSYNEVLINGLSYKTRGPVPDTNLAVFPGKITVGDYTQDSNPLLSSWVISDLTGGLGIEDMNEGTDVNRYRLGTFYTRYPNQISKPFIVNAADGIGSLLAGMNCRFLGNIIDTATGDWNLVYSEDTALKSIINGSAGTLTAEPVGSALVYQGTSGVNRVIIPMGASGIATYSSSDVFGQRAPGGTATAGTPALQCAVIWDNKLVGIDTSGQLWWTTNPLVSSDNWVSYGNTAKLPSVATPRSMTTYFDRQGAPAIFIVTDTDVWQFDPNGPELFTIDVSFPPHPHHGLAACKWGGDLYFSVGIGVHRYTGGSLSAVGLDRDAGLPIEYAGYILGGGLVPGYNSLFAFVQEPDLSGFTFTGSTPATRGGVYEFTGVGWHLLWESGASFVPYSMGISRVDHNGAESYILYWGVTDNSSYGYLRYITLPIGFSNPRQRVRVTGGFTGACWLETGIFDAGMKGYDKLANALDVSIPVMDTDAILTVKYKVNNADSWTILGIVTDTGSTSLPFGTLTDDIYPGLMFERIQFRFELNDGTEDGFILESAVLSFLKLTPPSWSWTVELDLTTSHAGRSPAVMIDEITDLLNGGVFVPFVLRGTTYRVFVAQVTGSLETGADESGFRRVSLLEIPQSLGG